MTDPRIRAVIVGDRSDPHLNAVLSHLPAAGTVVLDGRTVTDVLEEVTPTRTVLRDLSGQSAVLDSAICARGWIRRISPAGWDDTVTLGSQEAAVMSSRLALLAAVLHDPAVSWLSNVDTLFAAENKLVQYRAATRLGIRVPLTIVGPDAIDLARALGEPFILKPLGPGSFRARSGQQRVVFSRSVTAADLLGTDLNEAPFLAQKQLHSLTHLRVVTVQSQAWVTELAADGLPCDWRRDQESHESFTISDVHQDVAEAASGLAANLQCGYTSQDWIVDALGPAFIDLNPGGQWLFLPEPVAGDVTTALSAILRGGGRVVR